MHTYKEKIKKHKHIAKIYIFNKKWEQNMEEILIFVSKLLPKEL